MSDHFDGKRFFNPGGANGQPFWKVPRMLMSRRTPWPVRVPVIPQKPPRPAADHDIVISFVGHSTFLIQSRSVTILTDPVFVDRASPIGFAGPKRVRAPGITFDALPPISLVLLSHNHYDHCDLRTLTALERKYAPTVITALGNARLLRSAGLRKVVELDWWQQSSAWPTVWATPAQHFSARGPLDRNRALWGGFVVALGERRLFFAGDSGYASHFRAIGARLGPIDTALLPIGAYEPRWFMKDIHMNPAEAVQAHCDLGARRSFAMHFGTFQLTTEGIDAPVEALAECRAAAGLAAEDFRALNVGESAFV